MRAIAKQEARRLFDEAGFVRKSQIDEIVDRTVKRTLQGFGIDIENPTEAQENFANLRSWSELKKAIGQSIVTVISRSVIVGILALLVLGFISWLNGGKLPHL